MISYRQADLKVFEEGSNDEMRLRECIAFFELFLLNIGMKQVSVEDGVPLTYCDVIFFVTGSDRIPTYEFDTWCPLTFCCKIPVFFYKR